MTSRSVRQFSPGDEGPSVRSEIELVLFWAAWCRSATAASDAFVREANVSPYARWGLCDYELHRERCISWLQIRSIPTLVVFVAGAEFMRHSGGLQRRDFRRIYQDLVALGSRPTERKRP